jgi:hypothetical protein
LKRIILNARKVRIVFECDCGQKPAFDEAAAAELLDGGWEANPFASIIYVESENNGFHIANLDSRAEDRN